MTLEDLKKAIAEYPNANVFPYSVLTVFTLINRVEKLSEALERVEAYDGYADNIYKNSGLLAPPKEISREALSKYGAGVEL